MANATSKPTGVTDGLLALRKSYNVEDASLTTSTFVTAKIGHKITRTVVSATVDQYSYYDGATLLYTLEITYSNSAHDDVNQVERIA